MDSYSTHQVRVQNVKIAAYHVILKVTSCWTIRATL
jgi:hypothetical protein